MFPPWAVALEWPCCCCSHNNALAQAHACGGSNCKPRGIPTLRTKAQRKWRGRSAAEVCTSEARKIGEWLAGARGAHPLGRVSKGPALRAGTGVRLEAVWMIVQHERSELNLRFRPQ